MARSNSGTPFRCLSVAFKGLGKELKGPCEPVGHLIITPYVC